MTRKPLTKPRKTASQERSRATVDALVEATARILVKEGFDTASTNHIAEVAGVSVGSLYQYFPTKEALVAAVVERHQEEITQTVRGELADVLAPAPVVHDHAFDDFDRRMDLHAGTTSLDAANRCLRLVSLNGGLAIRRLCEAGAEGAEKHGHPPDLRS